MPSTDKLPNSLLPRLVDPNDRPLCFTNEADTQIPALRDWIHQLTLTKRFHTTKAYLTDLDSLITNVTDYFTKTSPKVPPGILALKEMWDTGERSTNEPKVVKKESGEIARRLIRVSSRSVRLVSHSGLADRRICPWAIRNLRRLRRI